MAGVIQPPPTWASPIIEDERTKETQFNPVWIKWFIDLVNVINVAGGGAITHNSTAGLQGGQANQYQHLTTTEYNDLQALGRHRSLSTTYISGTGTAGADNTAQTVVTVALAGGTLTQVGDRMRVRCYWRGDTGSPVTGTSKVNGVTAAATTDAGAATLQITEAWLHYVDATHANIISMTAGTLNTTISAANVAGFVWANSQDIIITQDAIADNHIVVYALIVDIFPKRV